MTDPTIDATTALASRYLEILSATDLGEIFQQPHMFSGIFLAGVPAGFEQSDLRVLVVGKEPKQWRDRTCRFRAGELPTMPAVLEAMQTQRAYLEKRAGQVKFIQFVKQVATAAANYRGCSTPSIHWGNLFCVSHSAGSPMKSRAFWAVQKLSAQLLRAQIAVVDPDVIFFTTGHSYDQFVHRCFPDRSGGRVIERRCLWEFSLARARCYRTSHPRYVAHNCWREQALRTAFNDTDGLSGLNGDMG